MQGLLRNEIANNWIVETGLSIAEAREKWPLGIAVGKFRFCRRQRAAPCLRQHRVPSEQVRPEEHGLLLFAFQGSAILGAVSRHSGGSALALSCFARSMDCWPVDDLLPDMFALVVIFFCAIAAPISWKKAQFLFGAVGRSTSPTTPFSSCPLS